MRIKSLKVSGFKSFCHSVDIKFQQNGITVVIGPNGCGKSNVVDAIRWVLGEQRPKHLRGGSMEDVIFNGSSYQKPMGMAEVTLTFTNTEGDTIRNYEQYTEIAITRRLYRSGESVYMINKTPVRLKDIRELFMDTGVGGTGYSIVEQGRVGEIVSARPADRRVLIDDAAGIVKFRIKREAAERRMEETLQNLLRVNDVLGALREQEEGLRDQVERARSFISLKEESSLIEKQLLCLNWHQAGANEKQSSQSIEEYRQKHQDVQNDLAAEETRLQQLSLEQTQRGAEIQQRREKVYEKEREIQEAENQRNLERQNLENVNEQQQRQAEELAELQDKLKFLEGDRNQGSSLADQLKTRVETAQESLSEFEQEKLERETELQEVTDLQQQLQKKLLKIHTELTSQTNQDSFLNERLESLLERQQKLKQQDDSHRMLHEDAGKKRDSAEEKTLSLRQQLDLIEEQLQHLEQTIETDSELIEEEETKLVEEQYQQSVIRSRLESLVQIQHSYEGFSDSVKTFMHLMQEDPAKAQSFGVLGVVADFINAETEALEQGASVMAEVLDWVVLKSKDQFSKVESFCESQGLGAMKFIALDRLPTESDRPTEQLSLKDFLEFRGEFESWGNRFFSRFLLDDDSAHFWNRLDNEWTGSTFEWLSANGSRLSEIAAGIGKAGTPTLGFLKRQQEISELEEEAEKLQQHCIKLEEELEQKQLKLSELRTEQQQQLKSQRETELEWLSLSKELEHHQLEYKRLGQMLEQNQNDLDRLEDEIEIHQKRQESVNDSLASLENQRRELDEELMLQEERIEVQKQRVEEISTKLLDQKVALTEALEQQKNLVENEQRLQREHLECERRIESLLNLRDEGDQKLQKSQQRIIEIDASFDQMLEQRELLKGELDTELELQERKNEEHHLQNQQLQEIRQKLEASNEALHQQSLKQTEFRMLREQLETQLAEISDQSPEELMKEIDADALDQAALSRESRSLKARISSMGNVNLSAPEEYEALMERIGFLSTQSEDLQQATDDLKKTIRDINNESRRRFREMFDQVNVKFREVFQTLFEGGDASMVLTESEDLLDAGIDIVAQPPGKKLQNLNLLSGGEKALTAISLIFAIFLIKPSPFCLLDEVDAPLDDANVVRFNRLIQSLTDNAQFIVITHNKKTMEIGDLLYGVTMENPGISKTVSVQFQEAQKLVA